MGGCRYSADLTTCVETGEDPQVTPYFSYINKGI